MPAHVFGNSSGATIGLELAARHPVQVLGAAFAESDDQQASSDAAARQEGRIPGGGEAPEGELDRDMMEMMARFEKNMEFFIGYEVPPFSRYVPDYDALRASPVRVVPAMGEDSAGEPPNRAAIALAERLGTRAVAFPGDHGGFGAAPAAFAARLREVLA